MHSDWSVHNWFLPVDPASSGQLVSMTKRKKNELTAISWKRESF